MEGENEGVMFEIGVMERPGTTEALGRLAKSVLDAQRQMLMGAESVGAAARGAADGVVSLTQQLKDYGATTEASIGNVEQAIERLKQATAEKLVQVVEVVVEESAKQTGSAEQIAALQAQANRARAAVAELREEAVKPMAPVVDVASLMQAQEAASQLESSIKAISDSPARSPIADELFAMFGDASKQLDAMQDKIDAARAAANELPANLSNVFRGLGDGGDAVKAIEDRIESALTETDFASEATAALRAEWSKRVEDQEKAYAKLRQSHAKAIEDNQNAVERINTQLAQGARGFVQSAKGFAQLGIMSEESGKKMLKGLVSIEAATNILGGIVDVVEMTSKGWRSMRQAVDAATKAKQIQLAMAGPEFAMLRSYQAALHAEAEAAAEATAANLALGRSRSAAAKAATSGAASAAASAGAKVAGGAVGSVAGGVGAGAASAGAASAGAGVAGVGLVATLAAFGAAVGAATLVLYELKEAATGQASSEKSLTMTIAKSEASIAVSLYRMTGAFERMDSYGTRMATSFSDWADSILGSIPIIGEYAKNLNFVGDIARAAASQAGVERGEKRLKVARLGSTRDEGLIDAYRTASDQIERERFRQFASRIRDSVDMAQMNHSALGEKSVADDAKAMRAIQSVESMRSADVNRITTQSPMTARNTQIDFDMRATQRRSSASVGGVDQALQAERAIQAEALRLLAEHEQAAAKAAEGLGKNSEAYKAQRKEVLRIEDEIQKSLDNQKRLTVERSAIEIQSQRSLLEGLQSKAKSYADEIQRLKGDYQSSAISFARMDDVEKQFAQDAIMQARVQGAGSLDRKQRELLRAVGSEESVRFANQADLEEAKAKGFDQTFGLGAQNTVRQLESQRQRIEAQISSAYDVSVNLKMDEGRVVGAIVSQAQALIDKKASQIVDQVRQELGAETAKIRQDYQTALREMKNNRG